MKALLNRFKEPSSYAGLAGILALVGVNIDAGMVQSVTFLLAGAAGVVAFFLPDEKPAA
jgi:hypothetical protein